MSLTSNGLTRHRAPAFNREQQAKPRQTAQIIIERDGWQLGVFRAQQASLAHVAQPTKQLPTAAFEGDQVAFVEQGILIDLNSSPWPMPRAARPSLRATMRSARARYSIQHATVRGMTVRHRFQVKDQDDLCA